MGRIFSNGRSGDFVINPFRELATKSSQISIAAPYVTKVCELIRAAQDGKRVELLTGLNAATDEKALSSAHREPNIRVRYYTHRRFHAKIYLFDSAAMVGSSNLTDGGLQANREGTILIEESEDPDAIVELRAVFKELWDFAPVLTDEILKRFTEARQRYRSDVDELIWGVVGKVEPPNISVESQKRTAERIYREALLRQIEEYRNAFVEVSRVLEENGLHRTELDVSGAANQANRFLSWVRRIHAPGDVWESIPAKSQDGRRGEILRLGREWSIPENDNMHEEYIREIRTVEEVFGEADTIQSASKEELTQGLTSLQAFAEQHRFVKGGTAKLPIEFWRRNNEDITKVKRSLQYLVYGGGELVDRLHGGFKIFCVNVLPQY